MIFQCAYIDNTISLKNIFLHGIVRDELGRKMSKSLGNGIDPTDVINTHGADALRTYLASNASGEDINFTESKIEHIEHFINKI
jgi:valyl-tRNA synthetase